MTSHRSDRHPVWRTRLLAGLGLLIVACGGGGSPEFLPHETSAQLSGRILFNQEGGLGLPGGPILEAEPNDTSDTAHYLGEIRAGSTLVVHGHTTAEGKIDPFDGFDLLAPERVEVTATLEFPDAGGNDFDLSVFDPISLQFVEVYVASTAPEVATFHAKGAFGLVVEAWTGSGDYILTIAARTPTTPIGEREPNDDSAEGQYLGELPVGDEIRVTGFASAVTDESDGVFVTLPAAARLFASVSFPAGVDFDLYVDDATEDLTMPSTIASFFGDTANPEQGHVSVSGGSLLFVDVDAWSGSGAWTLTLRADPPGALVAKTRAETGARIASLDAETKRGRRRPSDARYGRPARELVPGQVLVGYADDGAAPTDAVAKRGGRVVERSGRPFARVDVDVPADYDAIDRARYTLSRVAALRGTPGIAYAEPNYVLHATAEPDDTYYNLQWHYPLINLPEAWDVATGSASIIVAVIDTGRTDHPDLEGRQSGGYDFISSASNARDGDGQDADPTDEGDLLGPDGNSSFHGTHVAGTVGAATNNGSGVAGVTWATRIMHLRVLGRDGGTIEDIADAIRYAGRLSNGSGALPPERAHVINMSLGGGGFTNTLQNAITAARNAGVVIVAAAGNESTSLPSYPAAHDGVISVSAVDLNGNLAPYSNYGSTIDIAAPGGDTSADLNGDSYVDGVLSTMYDDSVSPPEAVHAFYQGTSMASPHVAGVAALILGENPSLTPAQVESILTSTATDRGPTGRDDDYGHGLVDAHAAVVAAQGGGGSDPVLVLSPTAVDFGRGLGRLDVQVKNAGGGFLELTSVTTSTQDGAPWLTAETSGSGDATKDVDAVVVRVDRTGLSDGSYAGRVTVTSNDGTREVQVLMSVSSAQAPLPDVPIYVLAIDPDTSETVAQVVVDPRASLTFRFASLTPGSYLVAAGTDMDDDGYICDEGEWCGMYPVHSDPVPIQLGSGEARSGIEFVVQPIKQLAAEGAAGDDCATPGRCGFRRR